jgi:hypothetical protein
VRGDAVPKVEPELARLTVHLQARDADRRRTLDRLTARNEGLSADSGREIYGLMAAGSGMRGQSAAAPEPIDLEPELQTVRAAVETCFTATAPDDL